MHYLEPLFEMATGRSVSRSIGATPTVTEGHEVNRRLLFSSRSSGQAGSGRR